jgi:hypothetical protein
MSHHFGPWQIIDAISSNRVNRYSSDWASDLMDQNQHNKLPGSSMHVYLNNNLYSIWCALSPFPDQTLPQSENPLPHWLYSYRTVGMWASQYSHKQHPSVNMVALKSTSYVNHPNHPAPESLTSVLRLSVWWRKSKMLLTISNLVITPLFRASLTMETCYYSLDFLQPINR